MKKLIFSMALILLIVSGCSSKEDAKKIEELQNSMERLHKEVVHLSEKQEQMQEKLTLTEVNIPLEMEPYNISLYQLEHLVNQLSNIELKKGYITEVEKQEDNIRLMVDFKEMINDENMPNGYRIEEMEDGVVELTEETIIYVLEDYRSEIHVPIEELEEKLNEYVRFMNFYFVDGKVALMTEQYLP